MREPCDDWNPLICPTKETEWTPACMSALFQPNLLCLIALQGVHLPLLVHFDCRLLVCTVDKALLRVWPPVSSQWLRREWHQTRVELKIPSNGRDFDDRTSTRSAQDQKNARDVAWRTTCDRLIEGRLARLVSIFSSILSFRIEGAMEHIDCETTSIKQ